jgi:polyisoprenoid-binding protein YceI
MRKFLVVANLLLVGLLAISALVPNATSAAVARGDGAWGVDAAHTEINFTVTHFFTPVTGSFRDFDVTLNIDADYPENSTVEARIAVASIDTGNERRDNHLRSADWFEAEQYPYMTFKSTSVRKVSADRVIARGELTIKGQSHEVELPITLIGVKQIPEQMREMLGGSREVASFKAATSIVRGDYDVGVGSWAANMVVGDDVGIEILLEAHNR